MKILHVSSARVDYPGGTEKVILEISTRQALNHEVTILQTNLYEENKKFEPVENRGDIKVITCQNDFFLGGFGYSSDFKKKLRKIWGQFDIVHIHGHGRFTSHFSMGFLKNKKPFIYSAQGFFHSKKNNFFKKLYDLFFSRRLRDAHFCTALTKLEKEKLLEMKVDEGKIKIIPGGIDFKGLQSSKELSFLREKYLGADNSSQKILLYVGRIHESKGIHHVLEAIKDLDVKFFIVGKDAGYTEKLENLAKKLKIESKIYFFGAVDLEELRDLYSLSDVFVIYSDWEGFGLVMLEAMACGSPVIGSNNGSIPLLIKSGFNGLIAKDQEELKKSIKNLVGNDTKRIQLGKNARLFAREFDWSNIASQHEKTYLEAIDE